jgi:hypothetical protein
MSPHVNLANYRRNLSSSDWYLQFQIRREILGYLAIREEYGDGADPIDARVQHLLTSMATKPIVELNTIRIAGFALFEFSLRIMFFIAEGCTPPAFVLRNRDFYALLNAFDGRHAVKSFLTAELPGEMSALVQCTAQFSADPAIYCKDGDVRVMLARQNAPIDFHGMHILAFDPNHSNETNRRWAAKCFDEFTIPAGETTRRPRLNFARDRNDRRKSSPTQAWLEYKTLAHIDLLIQSKVFGFHATQGTIATLLKLGAGRSGIDKLRKTVQPMTQKMLDPNDRLSKDLELSAQEDFKELMRNPNEPRLRWALAQFDAWGGERGWGAHNLKHARELPPAGDGIFQTYTPRKDRAAPPSKTQNANKEPSLDKNGPGGKPIVWCTGGEL